MKQTDLLGTAIILGFLTIFHYPITSNPSVNEMRCTNIKNSTEGQSLHCHFRSKKNDFLCTFLIPDQSNPIVFIIHVEHLKKFTTRTQIVFSGTVPKTTFVQPNILDSGIYRICALALTTIPSRPKMVDLSRNDSIFDVQCTQISVSSGNIEVPVLQVKPSFAVFLYLLCIILLISLVIKRHIVIRKRRRIRSISSGQSLPLNSENVNGHSLICGDAHSSRRSTYPEIRIELPDQRNNTDTTNGDVLDRRYNRQGSTVDEVVARILGSIRWKSDPHNKP
ncbi:hypothetical protein ACOME3_007097 [Neoechinorhynchus agilis]